MHSHQRLPVPGLLVYILNADHLMSLLIKATGKTVIVSTGLWKCGNGHCRRIELVVWLKVEASGGLHNCSVVR